jgi:hypothetical protein
MTMREFLLKFLEQNWKIVMLFFLLILLAGVHGFMIHYNRPQAVITWCENMFTGAYTALVLKLKD